MGYINQIQHTPSARDKKTLNYWNSTRMRPCTREESRLKSSPERSNTPYGTNTRKTIFFPLKLHLTALQSPDLCCDNGGSDGRDVQTGLTDRMVQQRHVGWFLYVVFGLNIIKKNKQDCFYKKTRRQMMSKNIILVLMYHRHKLLDLIYFVLFVLRGFVNVFVTSLFFTVRSC
jgi:hypothetical protein